MNDGEIINARATSVPEIATAINAMVAATEQHAPSEAQGAIEAGMLLASGVSLTPAKIAFLRCALTGVVEELDLPQQGGAS